MEKNYECICGFYYSSTDLVDHVEKAHIQVAIHRFVEDIKRVAKLEGLKKFAKELDKPPDLKPKRESRLKSRRKSTKSDDGKTTPSDSTLTDQKDDIKISKNIDKDNKHENDNVDRLSKKEDTISSYLPEDDGITQRIKKSDRSVSSESRDTSIETRRGKKLKKAESNVINKKENEENPVEDIKNVIQENPVEDVKNVIQDRNQITSPILEEELEFLEAFDSFENKTKDSHINRYRCTGCEFSSFEQTLISNHIGKVHKGSDIKPRLQEMRLILEQVVEKKTVDEADITSPRKRRGRPKKSSPLKESSKNPSDQIETENASENSEIKDNHKDLETSNVTETEQNISDQSIYEKSVEAREKHIDDLLNSDDDDELPEMPHEEDPSDNWSPAFGNIELHPVTNSSDEDDSLENTNDNKKNDTNETRNADRPKRSKEKWKVAKAKKSQEDNNTSSPISRSTTTDYSLSSRTARELKNLNITFNDTAWSNDNENDASNQQDLETKKSSRKRKVKNKEDALYSLLNYLLDQIMGKDVSQSFLEPINDEIAPGYSEVIKEPMDFSTMEYKLCQHKYQSLSEFIYDFNLVHSNCMIYNPEQSSYYNEGVKLKKFGEDFLSEENLQEIPSYSQLSDVDIGVPFQSEAEINADNQCKNKRSPNKDQKKKTRQPSENDSESDNFPPPFSAVLTISERVKLRQQMGLDLSNISLYKQKKKSKQQSTDNLEETSFEDLSSQPSTSTKESIPVEKEVLKNKENDDTEQREDKTDNETTSIPKANITLTPCDNDDNEDTPSPSPDSALIDAQNLENILTPVKAAENANILEEGTDKDQDENNSQTSNKQDDNPTRTAKASPWKRKLSVSSENSDQHARTLTPSKSRGTKRKRRAMYTRRKNRKKKTGQDNYEFMEEDEEENEEDDWFYEDGTSIQCCLCGKWRFLGEISENDITSLEYWDCSMNTDTSHNKCSDPEDEWDTTTTTTTAVGQQDNPTTSNDITDNINTTEITSNASLECEANFVPDSNPLMCNQYTKPKLTQRALILLAKQNLDPDSNKDLDKSDIAAFISLVFPYYNQNYEECMRLVKNKWKPDEMKDVRLSSSELNQLRSLSSSEQKGSSHACVKPDFLVQLVDACDYRTPKPDKSSSHGVHLSWGVKELLFLGLIAMDDVPLDILQVRHFLELSVPGIQSKLEGWTNQINSELPNMSEIQTINQGLRKLYCIRPEFKDSIKTLLQGDGMPNISTTENNASVPSANESQNVPIPTVNIPSGLQLVRRISQELQEPNKFPVPLEVIAFMKAFLGDFAPTKLDKMTMILNGIFKHLRRDEIEESLAGKCFIFELKYGELRVKSSVMKFSTFILQYWVANYLEIMKGDLKETSLFKIISFKSINEKEKVLQLLINSNTNLNKKKLITWFPTVHESIIFSLAVKLTANSEGVSKTADVKNFIKLHFPYYALTRTELVFKSSDDTIKVNDLETEKAVTVIQQLLAAVNNQQSETNQSKIAFMVQPEKVNCLLAPELRLPAASDSSFLTPRCDTAVLIATAIFYLGEILHGGYATSDLIAKFINFHFPAVKYLKVLTDLSLLSKSADKFVKYSWMFERHPSSHSLSIRLKPETLLSTFAICQEAVVNLSLQCMRCSSLIMLIYDLTPPYWDNYYAHRKQPQVVSNAITTPNTTTSTTTTPAPVIKLRNSTSLISTSAAQLSTATPQPLPTASPSISTSGASTTVSSTILPMPQKREKDPTPLVPAITKTIDTNTPLISPANIKRQPPTELEDSLPNIPSNTDNMPIEQDEEEGNQENDAANKPDLEIQVLIGMAIILYRIKEFFASDNGENNYYEGFAPEWDTPINQYILAQPFTLKQLVEWLDEVFVYYKRDNRIKEFLEEFKEKKNVLKYYFQIIEKSVCDGGIEFVYRSQLSRTGDLFQQIILQFLERDKMSEILENVEYVDITLSRKVNCSESTLFSMALLSLGNQNDRCRVDIVGELLPFLNDSLGYKIVGISQLEFEPSRNESERVSILSNLVDHDLFCLKGASLAFKEDVNIPDISGRISLYLRKLSQLNAVDFPTSVLNRFRNLKCEVTAPLLPCDYLLALALRNLAPHPGAGVSLSRVWNFLIQHFPYFKSFAAFPWRLEDLIAGTNFLGPNRFQFSQFGVDIMIHVPVGQAEELYEEMTQHINQRENSIMESLTDPDSLWNIVHGLLPPTFF